MILVVIFVMNAESESTRVVRVAPATVVIFAIVLCPFLLTAALLISRGQQIPRALGLCAVYVGAVSWICSPLVELSPNRLRYRTLFRRREITLSDVVHVTMSAKPAPTIALRRRRGSGAPLEFIVKPFSKRGVVAMLQHVQAYSPEVKLDRITTDMAAGDFRSITKETISSRNLLRIAMAASAGVIGAAIAQLWLHR